MSLISRRQLGGAGLGSGLAVGLLGFGACATHRGLAMPNESFSLVWEGLPNVMAVDRRGRNLVLQSHREGGLIVVDLASRKKVHRVASLNSSGADYGYGPGGSPLIISRDDARAVWTESYGTTDGDRRVFVRSLDLSSLESMVLAELTLRTGVLMQADTPDGLYLTAQQGSFLIKDGRATPIAVNGVDDLREPQVMTDDHTSWLLGYVIGIGAIAARLTGATAGPLQRLDMAGGPSFSTAGGAGLWIMGSGPPGVAGRLYLLDPETLATRGDFSIETNGSGGPSAIAAGPHGAFITAGDSLFRLTPQVPLPRLASPVSTTLIVDTETGLYGMTPYGVWRRDMSDFPWV